jgi:hypothetical protein
LRTAQDPLGPENDRHLRDIMSAAPTVIFAWGPLAKLPPALRNRWKEIANLADEIGCTPMCLGTTQDGQPRHPLMLAYSTPLTPWRRPS